MNHYRLTCLTPTLVGDGQKLAPIDYMVWKDHVNVLDQKRIFRLLARGPRLDAYLTQIRRAEKLDFASWGGFAQNFAGRRIPFEHASLAAHWERAAALDLFIPTFAAQNGAFYVPGSALKGPLRTALVASRTGDKQIEEVASRMNGERPPRRPAEALEHAAIGAAGQARTRGLLVSDSAAVPPAAGKIYLLRVSTLLDQGGKLSLGWKLASRGSVNQQRMDDSTPIFAEMAIPGTVFEGGWTERRPQAAAAARAVNQLSRRWLENHRQYAETAGLGTVAATATALLGAVEAADAETAAACCVFPLGWGGGFASKTVAPDFTSETFRGILRAIPLYSRAARTGLPFPKTRKIVFLNGRPASLPGWVRLDLMA